MPEKQDKTPEVVIEGLEYLDTHILQGEVSLVHRIMTDLYETAEQSKDQNPQLIELCKQLGFQPRNKKHE